MPPSVLTLVRQIVRVSVASLLLVLWILPPAARAQYALDVYSARAMGMGGAVRALPSDASAVDLNPAAMALFSTYLVELGYRYYPPQAAHGTTMSFLDAMTSKVASGFRSELDLADNLPAPEPEGWVVVGDTASETARYRGQSYRLGIGIPLVERLSAGATLSWYRQKTALEPLLDDTPFDSRFSLTVGAEAQLSPTLHAALVGTNLIPTHITAHPTTVSAGLAGVAGDLAMGEIDVVVDFTSIRDIEGAAEITREMITTNIHAGFQAMVAGHFPVRAGFYTERQTGSYYATIGTGIETPRGRIGYALQYRVRGGTDDPTFDGPIAHFLFIGAVIGH